MLRVAILLTVHNRRETTLRCLENCWHQIDAGKNEGKYDYTVYLVDDGSTDGTSEAVQSMFPQTVLIKGDGNLFWNRGMRLAWDRAAAEDYDFYLWLNDDTLMNEGALASLMENSEFLRHKAIVVGTTANAAGEITYGGRNRARKLMTPDPVIPIPCHLFNGNLVLVPKSVYASLGNLIRSTTIPSAISTMACGRTNTGSTVFSLRVSWPCATATTGWRNGGTPPIRSGNAGTTCIRRKAVPRKSSLFMITGKADSCGRSSMAFPSISKSCSPEEKAMGKFVPAIQSMRLRTLPLSLAGVLLGTLLAVADYKVKGLTVLFLVLTTICLQILSNLSNELGDVLHGTDTADRQGPQYGLNGGGMSVADMKRLIGLFVVLCVVFGLAMIKVSFGRIFSMDGLCLVLLGFAAISGAMKYTLGRNPYGYRGLGDVFVFLFFGLVAVLGSYFVVSHAMPSWLLLLPASGIGFFSIGVLNVNNIRDMKTDAPNRTTVALMLGLRRARIYQTVLIVLGWACMIGYCLLRFFDPWHYLFVITLPLYILHLKGVWTREERALDPMLPLLVLSTFALALLMGFGFVKFLL